MSVVQDLASRFFIAALVGAVLALLVAFFVARAWGRARRRRRGRVASAGEREAERLLERAGYRVVDRQVRARFSISVDGVANEVEVRVDLLVSRGGKTMVAEVKTGDMAPDPTHPPTRRQLLEYAIVFGAEEVLLVDVPAGCIRVVGFGTLLAAP